MPQPQVYDAVATRLAAVWTESPVEMESNNPHRAPADGAMRLAVEFHGERSSRITIGAPGNNLWRDEGALRLILLYPAAGLDGVRGAMARCATLAEHFRAASFGGVTTFAPSPAVPDRSRSTGNYIVFAFVVPYQFDFYA